ncbi:MAG: hypothetical protein Kow0010_21070 [Dehalococcoidia bacterium]
MLSDRVACNETGRDYRIWGIAISFVLWQCGLESNEQSAPPCTDSFVSPLVHIHGLLWRGSL